MNSPEVAAQVVDVTPVNRPSARFVLRHPAHWFALGFGSGLAPIAPGTAGTLWAWVAFAVFSPWISEMRQLELVALSLLAGWWLCSITAKHLQVRDPSCIVWDEIAAFWLVLCLVMPAGLATQLAAFLLFRFFDAVKPGPVAWADSLFHSNSASHQRATWLKAGFAIMFDDVVAAGCTLLVLALYRAW